MSKNTSSVADRTLKVLMLFSEEKLLSVSEIAELADINISSAYRVVNTLKVNEFLVEDIKGQFSLNPATIMKLFNIINKDMREHIKPILIEISNELNASVYLSKVHKEKQIIIVEKEDSNSNLRWVETIGYTYDIPTGTAGKTHLAYILRELDEAEKSKYLNDLNLVQHTEKSVLDIDVLIKDTNRILEDGYCMTEGEHLEGVVGISVPVFNFTKDKCIYALTLIVPSNFFNMEDQDYVVMKMKEGARKISEYIT